MDGRVYFQDQQQCQIDHDIHLEVVRLSICPD